MPSPVAVNPVRQNIQARMNLLGTGVRMVKKLQTVSGGMGSLLTIPLDRTGILTAVELHVSATLNIATADTTPNNFSIYSLINQLKYTDFAGVDRIVMNGALMNVLDSVRAGKLFNEPAASLTDTGTDLFQVPPNVVNATAPLFFVVRIPIAYSENDLTGAVLAQTAVGQHSVSVQLAQALAGADALLAPFVSTSTAALVGEVKVTAFQEYIQPQDLRSLPLLDLSTVYALEGNYTTTDNLSAGQQKYINYPNMRYVLSAMVAYNNGNVFNPGTDIDAVRVIANSNVNLMDATARYLLRKQRAALNGDLPAGTYVFNSRAQPINTTLYGNVQIGLTPSSVGTPSYMSYAFETKYPSGQPLPGIAQGA